MTENNNEKTPITVRKVTDDDIENILTVLQPKSSVDCVNDLLSCCELAADYIHDENGFIAEISDEPVGAFRFCETIDSAGKLTARGSINVREEYEDRRADLINLLEWNALKSNFNRVSIAPISDHDFEILPTIGYEEVLDQRFVDTIPEVRLQRPTIFEKELKLG